MNKATLFILFFVSVAHVMAQLPANVPAQGLLAWYSFNGNAQDLSGNGNHLTNFNAVLTADRLGNAASAYSFNGTTSYLTNNTPSWTMSDTSSFTIALWANKPSTTVGVMLMHGSTVNGNFIYLMQATATVSFGTNKQGSAWAWAQTAMPANTWVHLVGVYHNKSMTLYKDGLPVAYNTFTHTSVNTALLPFYVGRGVGGSYTLGLIDDVGVWNRALSAAEVWDLYDDCPDLILNQPQDQVHNILENAVFRIDGDSTTTSYQWQYFDGLNYLNITNGGQYSGATTDSLTISNLSKLNNGLQLRCVLSTINCMEESDLAQLTVNCVPLITTQPVNQTANTWSVATFSLSHIGTNATYQWQKLNNAVWMNLIDTGQYAGTTSNTLIISTLQMTNNGQLYRCLVEVAGCADTSSVAMLSVISGVGMPDDMDSPQVQLFPNPASGKVFIRVTPDYVGSWMQVNDLYGKTLFSSIIREETQTLHLSKLSPGIYTVHIDGKFRVKKKLIIQ